MTKPDAVKAVGMLMESDRNFHVIIAVELLNGSWKLTTFDKSNIPLEFYNLIQVTRFLEGK